MHATTSPQPSKPESAALAWVDEFLTGTAVEESSRRLFEHFYPKIHRFFSRRGFSHHDAEDLAQSVFLQLFSQLRSFQGDGSFESWLFAIAANLLRNEERHWQRDKRAGQEVPLDAPRAAPDLALVADQARSPEQEALAKQQQLALQQALEGLPPQMQACFRLRFEQGLKYREIATLLKISIDTVKAHLHQARHRLQQQLGTTGQGAEPP